MTQRRNFSKTQLKVRIDSSVTYLLTEISRKLDHYYMTNKVEGQYHDQVDIKTDYLAFKDRIELLLPRSELLKNFTYVQSNHLVPIELNLIKESKFYLLSFDSARFLRNLNVNKPNKDSRFIFFYALGCAETSQTRST